MSLCSPRTGWVQSCHPDLNSTTVQVLGRIPARKLNAQKSSKWQLPQAHQCQLQYWPRPQGLSQYVRPKRFPRSPNHLTVSGVHMTRFSQTGGKIYMLLHYVSASNLPKLGVLLYIYCWKETCITWLTDLARSRGELAPGIPIEYWTPER